MYLNVSAELLRMTLLYFLLLWGAAGADQDFYFGVWLQSDCGRRNHYGNDPEGFVSMLRDTLGFNLVETGLPQHYGMMADSGLSLIARPFGSAAVNDSVYPLMYANHSSYVLWEANPESLAFYPGNQGHYTLRYRGQPKLEGRRRHFRVGQAEASAEQPEQYGPNVRQATAYLQAPWGSPENPGWLNYTSAWIVKVTPHAEETADSVATLSVVGHLGDGRTVELGRRDLLASDYTSSTSQSDTVFIRYDYRDLGDPADLKPRVEYLIDWHGHHDLSIAGVLVYDDRGWELMHHHEACGDSIAWYVTDKLADSYRSILFFGTRDDLSTGSAADQVLPMQQVNRLLIEHGLPGLLSAHSWNIKYAEALGLPGFTTYPYPYLWANYNYPGNYFVHHFSDKADSTLPEGHHTLQHALGTYTTLMNQYREYADRSDATWLATLQSFHMKKDGIETHRYPTQQEFLCQFYLTLCYAPDGILWWKYFPYSRGDSNFVDKSNHWEPAQAYRTVRDYLAPLTETLLPRIAALDWQVSWMWGEEPPTENWIDSITCNEYSADHFYLQVAQFGSIGNDARYLLLVNRRCLPEETISGELYLAPPGEDSLPGRLVVGEFFTGREETFSDSRSGVRLSYRIPPGSARFYRVGMAE